MINLFSRLISRFPCLVLTVVGSFCVGLTILAFFTTELPDFSDPNLGFKTRGTEISDRLLSWDLLQEAFRVGDKRFHRYPPSYDKEHIRHQRSVKHKERRTNKKSRSFQRRGKFKIKRPMFCESKPSINNVILIFEVGEYQSPETIEALCKVEANLWHIGLLSMIDHCTLAPSRGRLRHKRCCQPWHLASQAAHYAKVNSCMHLNLTHQWPDVWDTVMECSAKKEAIRNYWNKDGRYPFALHFLRNCSSEDMNDFFKYYLPSWFPNFRPEHNITAMILPLPAAVNLLQSSPISRQFIERLSDNISVPGAKLIAMDFGMRDEFFDYYLIHDSYYGALSITLVMVCMWLYTGSLVFTAAAIFGIVLSAGLSFAVYQLVFRMPFFPFMNLLTIVLLIGVGADDTFILRRSWLHAKHSPSSFPLSRILQSALTHACLSMLVTSVTTAAAFYANLVSDIIAIKCFGLFAGTTILSNYLIVITWLPAAIVLIEKYDSTVGNCQENVTDWIFRQKKSLTAWICCKPCQEIYKDCTDYGRILFEKLLPWFVIRMGILWLLLFTCLSAFFGYSLFYSPGLKLPDKDHFQYFKSWHPFERFESEFRRKFDFLRPTNEEKSATIRVIWGLNAGTDAGTFDPRDKGKLSLWPENEFHFTENLYLLWLKYFCTDIIRANFTNRFLIPAVQSCFVFNFMDFMKSKECFFKETHENLEPCCQREFPYLVNEVETCIGKSSYLSRFKDYQFESQVPGLNGPIFVSNGTDFRFRILIITFQTTFNLSLSFPEMDSFYQTINSWVETQLSQSLIGVRNGWFINEYLDFYDLQSALARGTWISVSIALPLACLILFLITLNIVISVLALLSIIAIIISTIGMLALLEWQLNVLESTIIILAIGLSFDFTLHYAVAYRFCAESDRESRVTYALSRVGSPIFMSFITTVVAGVAMLPCTTLAYCQIGIFMIIMSSVSWLYSTFFFCPLLHRFGPSGNCCQLTILKSKHTNAKPTSAMCDQPEEAPNTELEPMVHYAMRRHSTLSYPKNRTLLSIRRASMPVVRRLSAANNAFLPEYRTRRISEESKTSDSNEIVQSLCNSKLTDVKEDESTEKSDSGVTEKLIHNSFSTNSITVQYSNV